MLSYKLPTMLNQDINQFEKDIERFKAGDLHETAFTAKRVKMGIYMERNYKTYMCRVRCAGNIITPMQLTRLAKLGQKYGQPRVHITTRAEVQLHEIDLENLTEIFKELAAIDLSPKGGGGHTIRNIITNHDSGIHPGEIFDVQPYVIALTERFIAEVDSFELPRKFKTAFSSTADDTARCILQDLGFIAKINEKGEKGFQVYAGGGLGAKPKIGILLHDFIFEDKVYHIAKAMKNVFHAHGNRRHKHHNRIRFLIHDDLGIEPFKKRYREELDKIYDDDSLTLHVKTIDNEENLSRSIDLKPIYENIKGYGAWYSRNVVGQKQKGLFEIKVPLNLGDLESEDCLKLENILRSFGDNVLRCGMDQNIYIRNIPEKYLKNVYKGIKQLNTLSDKPAIYGKLVPCTGAQTCQIGINYPRPATTSIFKFLEKSELNFNHLDDINLHISGCPNSCANHWIGDLAFYGKVRHVNGHSIPTYNVLGGAKIAADNTVLGEPVGWVHSYDLPRFLSIVLKNYQDYKIEINGKLDFYQYWKDQGKNMIGNLCKAEFNQIPTFEEDKNYYFDHGALEIFSVKDMGRAECSAGIYDMINVDDKAIKKNLRKIQEWKKDPKDLCPILKDTVFFASRMLLVTRGEDPKTEKKTYDLFLKHFVETGIVDKINQLVVESARDDTYQNLLDNKENVVALGKEVTALYKGMDNTMRFPGETENLAITMVAKTEDVEFEADNLAGRKEKEERKKPDRFKDLRGVKCPINFAQTKVQLAAMKAGETLEVFLDEGEPINNVSSSVKLEGHIILKQEKNGAHWAILIEKAT